MKCFKMVYIDSGGFMGRKVNPKTVLAPYVNSCYESYRFCNLAMNNKTTYYHKMIT